ncbi:hypothetical protein DERF_009905 [Dermatophagoides farinae]|uniref:Uncharacterized protein n=1 Tax=Dermatophagoides farinae TaxID=6954 RepID=A0A922HUY6_DERFA|nr:hypothetical protein DERF_009905 [Dermatophagoides farinae]
MPSIGLSLSCQNCFVFFYNTSMCSIFCSSVESRKYLYHLLTEPVLGIFYRHQAFRINTKR